MKGAQNLKKQLTKKFSEFVHIYFAQSNALSSIKNGVNNFCFPLNTIHIIFYLQFRLLLVIKKHGKLYRLKNSYLMDESRFLSTHITH